MIQANWSCLRLFRQTMAWALALARDSAGRRSAAKIAMMAITTNNSIKVKPLFDPLLTLPRRGTPAEPAGTRLDIAFTAIPRVSIRVWRPTSSPLRRAQPALGVPEGGGAFGFALPDIFPI